MGAAICGFHVRDLFGDMTLHRITTVELDCLKRLATVMKQHLDEFHTIPPPGHPIWRVFWAWSHINRIIYHHHDHPIVSSGSSVSDTCLVEKSRVVSPTIGLGRIGIGFLQIVQRLGDTVRIRQCGRSLGISFGSRDV
jgi:hypothetical protein